MVRTGFRHCQRARVLRCNTTEICYRKVYLFYCLLLKKTKKNDPFNASNFDMEDVYLCIQTVIATNTIPIHSIGD